MNITRTTWRPTKPFALSVFVLFLQITMSAQSYATVHWWTSSRDMSKRLTSGPRLSFDSDRVSTKPTIRMNGNKTYQTIIGLGSSLEHSTCYNLSLLSPGVQEDVVERIVCPDKGIGMSLMRVCIGTPDFTASPWYSYDDVPPGQTDPELKHFSIEKDRKYVLPALKLSLKKNPTLRFFASPWSPPAWMKSNRNLCGGRINPDCFRAYAEYLTRFVEAYRDEGINILAITPQNEPEYFPGSYPTCGWTAIQQRNFIRDHLGPVFKNHGLKTKIWCYDHNFNHPQFPTTILSDPMTGQYVDGIAFHHYEGQPSTMSDLHERFPNKHVYFTEGSTFGIAGAVQIVSFLRNWARCYNAWVTMIDHQAEPNPGPHDCSPTCIVLKRDTLELEYRFDYYMYGHFMKFIRPGAVRIDSHPSTHSLPNVAFRNPDGSVVLVVVNSKRSKQKITIEWIHRYLAVELDAESIATFRTP